MTSGGTSRVAALDSLRGLAALSVVIYHGLLVAPEIAVLDEGVPPTTVFQRLSVLVGQPGPVIVFFVLSGYVLTIAFNRPAVSWGRYGLARVARLLLPVWATTTLAFFVVLALPRTVTPGASSWVNRHASGDMSALDVARHYLPVLPGHEFTLVGPLWTMRWELVFSAALPVAVWMARRLGSWGPGLTAVAILVSCVGADAGSGFGTWLPIFFVGVGLAAGRSSVEWVAASLVGWRLAIVLAFALTCLWLPQMFGAAFAVSVGFSSMGAAALIVACMSPGARRALRRPGLLWLGSRSFSLYLTHEIILFLVFACVGATASAWLVLAAVIPTALLFAEGFYRVVEVPALLLSRRLGSAVKRPESQKPWSAARYDLTTEERSVRLGLPPQARRVDR